MAVSWGGAQAYNADDASQDGDLTEECFRVVQGNFNMCSNSKEEGSENPEYIPFWAAVYRQ